MRQTRKVNFFLGKLVYVVTGILVIILVVLILGTVFRESGNENAKKSNNTMIDAQNSLDIGEVKNALKKDTIPELTELIQQYYTAMSACDITTLEQIVSPITDEDKDIIRRKKDYIESYNNVTVYSKLCPVDGSYLVFAVLDMKFKNEDTMAPGMEIFVVKTSENKNLYIYMGEDYGAEVENFIDEQLASDTVQTLRKDVNDRYVEALASSSTLLEFLEGFEGGDKDLIEKAKAKAAQAANVEAKASPAPSKEPEKTNEPEATPTPTSEPTQAPTEEPVPSENVQAGDTNETVLITANVNLRNGNDETAERITTMIVGDQATRISITDNGWSKVQYNGIEGYVKSDYVTTFKVTSDTVKPTTTVNVRLEASETAKMAGQITPDTTLTRYAICNNGWSQVQYDGSVGYVKSEFLTN